MIAKMLTTSLVSIEMDMADIRFVSTQSVGAIKSATIAAYEEGARTVDLTAVIWNAGAYNADYITTVTELGPCVMPVYAWPASVNVQQTAQNTFKLRSETPFTATNTCVVQLLSQPRRRSFKHHIQIAHIM
jgi:hypothetical protein